MTIVCDKYIPFLVETIRNEWPDVNIHPMKSEEINASVLHDADVLVVRTRTKVNAALLEGTNIKLVCTATIGSDHIDTTYCDTHGIRWMACPGCNAQAVCDYIEEVLCELSVPNNATIGIVGVGHVGSLVAKMAERRGFNVLLNDPPKHIGVSLDQIAQNSDIITFHTPLDNSTHHLCNAAFLKKTKPDALIINAARGGVVDEMALIKSGRSFVLDTWEGEPYINTLALQYAKLATMHVAGYSVEGKKNATQMCLDVIADYGKLPPVKSISCSASAISKGDTSFGWITRVSQKLKAQSNQFEQLRQSYPLR